MSKTIKAGGFRHGLHLWISLFTCGIWLFTGYPVCWLFWLFFGSKKVNVKID